MSGSQLNLEIVAAGGAQFQQGTSFSEGPILLGRSARNAIILDSAAVSRTHAVIDLEADGWHVRHKGSLAPTKLNGVELPKDLPTPVNDGDLLEIEGLSVRISLPDAVADIPAIDPWDAGETMLPPSAPPPPAPMAEPAYPSWDDSVAGAPAQAMPGPAGRAIPTVVATLDTGEQLQIELRDVGHGYVVGRSTDCELTLPVNSVSRKHAQFRFDGTTVYVRDVGGRNPILVNGAPALGEAPLSGGDRVSIGTVTLELVTEAGAPAAVGAPQWADDPAPAAAPPAAPEWAAPPAASPAPAAPQRGGGGVGGVPDLGAPAAPEWADAPGGGDGWGEDSMVGAPGAGSPEWGSFYGSFDAMEGSAAPPATPAAPAPRAPRTPGRKKKKTPPAAPDFGSAPPPPPKSAAPRSKPATPPPPKPQLNIPPPAVRAPAVPAWQPPVAPAAPVAPAVPVAPVAPAVPASPISLTPPAPKAAADGGQQPASSVDHRPMPRQTSAGKGWLVAGVCSLATALVAGLILVFTLG